MQLPPQVRRIASTLFRGPQVDSHHFIGIAYISNAANEGRRIPGFTFMQNGQGGDLPQLIG